MRDLNPHNSQLYPFFRPVHKRELRERGGYGNEETAGKSGLNTGRVALFNYYKALQREVDEADDEEELGNAVSTGGGNSLPARAPAIIKSGLDGRFTEVNPVLRLVNDPEQMKQLEDNVQKIIEQDKLEKLDTEDLAVIFRVGQDKKNLYTGEQLILRVAKNAEAGKGKDKNAQQPGLGEADRENAAANDGPGAGI